MTIESNDSPVCPYCGAQNDMSEIDSDCITYWGSESGPVEVWCDACDLSYLVHETVSRTWSSETMEQEEVTRKFNGET